MLEHTDFNHFFNYVQIQPKNYVIFADKKTRGLSSSKAFISIKNISKLPIVYRVVQKEQNLIVKVRPFILLLMPNDEKKIELLFDSDQLPTLNNSLIIEIIEFKNNVEQFTPKLVHQDLFNNQNKLSYELKFYQTNLLNIICFEYQFEQLEIRINKIENLILKWLEFESNETKSIQITIILITFVIVVFIFLKKYLPFNLIY